MFNHIMEKEREYSRQMQPIRDRVLAFGDSKGWTPIRRGRHAHASISGPVRDFQGIIDIQMDLIDWEAMPWSLPDDYPFTLWASAGNDDRKPRLFSLTELCWQMPFAQLHGYTDIFLDRAWQMLSELSSADFVDFWPGPSKAPDTGPNFGGPRKRD